MQNKLLPRPLMLGGAALIALATWLGRANRPLAAATQQNLNQKTISATVGVDTHNMVEAGNVSEICGLSAEPKLLSIFDSSRAGRVKASSDTTRLAVYAVRLPDGAAVCIANKGDDPANIKLGIRLPRGAYALERTLLVAHSSDKTDPSHKSEPETSPALERLQSMYMDHPGWLWRPGKLESNQVAIYRFTNRSAEVQTAYNSLAVAMRNLRSAQPHEYRLLASATRICEDNVAALSRGTSKAERFRMLRYIHRALLAVGQAQAFSRNAAGGREIHDSLDRFEDSLANLSAALLTLVPSLDVAVGTDSQARKVTVKLTNCGEKSIENLRMGVETPQGGRVWPGDRAMFSNLKPGECARATYSVRFPEADANPRIGAEITYFIANAPARLHVESGL